MTSTCCITIRQHYGPCQQARAGPGTPINTTSVPDRDGGEKGEAMYLSTTTDSIRCLLRGVLGFCGLHRTHCAIDFALEVVRDGLARRLCSFEE